MSISYAQLRVLKELYSLITKKDLAGFRDLIPQCLKETLNYTSKIHTRHAIKIPLIHHAIQCQNIEFVRVLVAFGCDLDIETEACGTPLLHAITLDREDICKILIGGGCDIDKQSVVNFEVKSRFPRKLTTSPLWYTLFYEIARVDIMRLLVRSGCNLETKVGLDTPIFYVTSRYYNRYDLKVVKCLVEGGCNLNVFKDGRRPHERGYLLNFAIRRVTFLAQYFLEQGCEVDFPDVYSGWSPLRVAIEEGNVLLTRMIISRTRKINDVDDWMRGYLFHAINRMPGYNSFLPILADLIAAGVSVETPAEWGVTPLNLAAFNGHGKTLEFLLENNFQIIPKWDPLDCFCVDDAPQKRSSS